VTDPRSTTTAAALPAASAAGGVLATVLIVVAALGVGRAVLRLGGLVVLGGVVLATVGALAGGIVLLHAAFGH